MSVSMLLESSLMAICMPILADFFRRRKFQYNFESVFDLFFRNIKNKI